MKLKNTLLALPLLAAAKAEPSEIAFVETCEEVAEAIQATRSLDGAMAEVVVKKGEDPSDPEHASWRVQKAGGTTAWVYQNGDATSDIVSLSFPGKRSDLDVSLGPDGLLRPETNNHVKINDCPNAKDLIEALSAIHNAATAK